MVLIGMPHQVCFQRCTMSGSQLSRQQHRSQRTGNRSTGIPRHGGALSAKTELQPHLGLPAAPPR